jgi:pimeloyl-CoA synthetase
MSNLSEIVKTISKIVFKTEKPNTKEEENKNIQHFLSQCGQYDKDCHNLSIEKLKELYPNMKEEEIEDDRIEITRVVSRFIRN